MMLLLGNEQPLEQVPLYTPEDLLRGDEKKLLKQAIADGLVSEWETPPQTDDEGVETAPGVKADPELLRARLLAVKTGQPVADHQGYSIIRFPDADTRAATWLQADADLQAHLRLLYPEGSGPTWVWSDDEAWGQGLAVRFDCPYGLPADEDGA